MMALSHSCRPDTVEPHAHRLAVFDCDGTLVDGQAEICTAMCEAFASLGLAAPDKPRVRRAIGLSLSLTMRQLLPDADDALLNALIHAYKSSYRRARDEGRLAEPLFDGIREMLNSLRANGWSLAVATGKSDRGLGFCLAANGLSDHFVTLQTADRHPSKPHPAMLEAALTEALVLPEHAVMIGDTAYDMAMAKAAGVRAIGVAWGYHDEAELRAAGAEAMAYAPHDLLALLA